MPVYLQPMTIDKGVSYHQTFDKDGSAPGRPHLHTKTNASLALPSRV